MFQLPLDIQRHIFSFDPTYHEKYQEVIENIIPIKKRVIQEYCYQNCTELIDEEDNIYTFGDNENSYTEELDIMTMDEYSEYVKETLVWCNYSFIKRFFINDINEELYNYLEEYNDYAEASKLLLSNIDFDLFFEDIVFINNIEGTGQTITINNTDYYVKKTLTLKTAGLILRLMSPEKHVIAKLFSKFFR